MHSCDMPFRYALFGKQHISPDRACIRGIQFTIERSAKTVFMHDYYNRFGHIVDPEDGILNAIGQKRPDHLKGDLKKGRAMVSYFTGDYDVLPKKQTVLGTVRAFRELRMDLFGWDVKGSPYIAIDFDNQPTTLEGAWEKMRWVRQFFAWMMGYAPQWNDVRVYTLKVGKDGFRVDRNGYPDEGLEVFGPNEWKDVAEDVSPGTLIDASRKPDHFMAVMQKWLERNSNVSRRRANARFFGSLEGMNERVIEDGIISAANTFDLLPEKDKPISPLSGDIYAILENARKKIRTLPDSRDRDYVLSMIGVIKSNKTLRSIVEHRAKEVLNCFGHEKLDNFEDVIALAIKCRDYYTHGPDDSNAKQVHFSDLELVIFLRKTLEFIYAASELLLCGWDGESVRAERHPIGGYVKWYELNRSVLSRLK